MRFTTSAQVLQRVEALHLNIHCLATAAIDDAAVNNFNIRDRAITSVGLQALDRLDDVHTLEHLTKHDVLAVQPRGLDGGDEELRALGVGA
jgi:hypothetical protein